MIVHLIDGTFELFRAHFGAPERKSPDGMEIGASVGWMRSLWRLLNEPDVTHIAVAFDHTVTCFRNDMFDGYKTGEGLEPELFAQFPLAEDVARALGCVVWPMVDFEADDALATAAYQLDDNPNVEQIIICSPDKDLSQCVKESRIVTFDRIRKTKRDQLGVVEKFGVSPTSIPDYLALVGDTADGIPGLKGWGAKSSGMVLGRYGSIDAIPEDAGDWDVKVRGAAKLAATLREEKESAQLYKALATLRLDVPIDASVDTLQWKSPDASRIEAMCQRLGISASAFAN